MQSKLVLLKTVNTSFVQIMNSDVLSAVRLLALRQTQSLSLLNLHREVAPSWTLSVKRNQHIPVTFIIS